MVPLTRVRAYPQAGGILCIPVNCATILVISGVVVASSTVMSLTQLTHIIFVSRNRPNARYHILLISESKSLAYQLSKFVAAHIANSVP